MKRLLLFLCLPLNIFCQNTIGLPDITNYSKQSYSAGLQNWDIKQDKNGIIYVANNEGLLSFDGKNWNLYSLPNKTIVRSVEIGTDHKIYVGGQDELGYFSPGKNGVLVYHSLRQFIPKKDQSFGDVWDIVSLNKNVFFRSTTKIFKLTGEAVATYYARSDWSYIGLSNGKIYAQDYSNGLMSFSNDTWEPVSTAHGLPPFDLVTSILPMRQDSSLITTLKHGLYILSKSDVTPVASVNTQLFGNERIYSATKINADWFALATSNNGVYIVDINGNIIQSFSKIEGLQNNNVLSIFLDTQSNLWLGLDNGIDLIAYNSSIKLINPLLKGASGYNALIFNSRLYAGTSNGLYSVPIQAMNDLSFCKGNFVSVNNTTGQTWGLAEINQQLLLGHHEGAFVIRDNTAERVSTIQGFWNFVPLSGIFPTAQLIGGNYKGITFFDYEGGKFIQKNNIPGFIESSRFVAIDQYDNTWISHPYHGVFRISKNAQGTYAINTYTDKQGLPSPLNNHVYKIRNEVVVATEQGVFRYNEQKDRYEPSPLYSNLLGKQSIRYLKEDKAGNIWFIHEKSLGVIDLSGEKPSVIYLPELNNKLLSGFEFIYPVNDNNIFLGGEKGFFHINYEKYKKTLPNLQVQIRSVRIINKKDSILFGGYFKDLNQKQVQEADNIPAVNHQWKTIHFEFSSALFGYLSNLEYSYRLKGFDENWSEWAKRTEKEYTNLPAGKFTFEVKARTNLGKESEIASYSFTMLPPWYRAIWAITLYLFILMAVIYAIIKWQQKKFRVQQAKHEEEQKKLLYIHELEINKTESELIALSNEKLEADINFKNSELAASAMHLVKKGELISKIKGELVQVMKGFDNPQANGELKKMIKTLSEDDNMDKEWDNFTKHFDKVHSDFLSELKEKHSAITPSELKLCAYLRMNLSTKEIAQLLNISVRGVEISRYRLRKKLQIQTETSLFDYLIDLKKRPENNNH